MHDVRCHIDTAYRWLCHQRRNYPADADVWDLRFHWVTERRRILEDLQARRYRFAPVQRVRKASGEVIHLWDARDALVLKMLALYLGGRLPVSRRCTHVKGHGGLKHAVRAVHRHLPRYGFVLRTDVKAYYESIDHFRLLEHLARYIRDRFMLNLFWQALHRTLEHGGLYRDIEHGLPRGCPLSPLFGALFLSELDQAFARRDLFYVRYMDDILILASSRWRLRKAVKTVNQTLEHLGLEKHPDKTFIGRVEKGFDFLGYHFSSKGLTIAEITGTKFVARLHRLYEQKKHAPECAEILGEYVRRWQRWTVAGLHRHQPVSIKTQNNTPCRMTGCVVGELLSVLRTGFPSSYPD